MANSMNHKNRRSIRLQGYDYSQEGAYYVTICTQNKLCLFGVVTNGKMILNDAGKMIEMEWLKLKDRFPNIDLHEYIVMPNHFHGIIEIVTVGVPLVGTQNEQNKTVGDIMDVFKSITTVEYIRGVKNNGWKPFNRKLWQRNYYEHIVRDGNDYDRIVNYIRDNPSNWGKDDLYMQK